jgi:cell division protein ZapE
LSGEAKSVRTRLQTVRGRLQAEVSAGRLEPDAAQNAAAATLDALATALRRRSQSLSERWWPHLPWLPASAASETPKGVYLWGGVGRGKTLLMDAFVASLAGVRRERSHFYRFMRRVHAELARIKDREDPLESVAEHLAKQARLLCLDEFMVADIADAMILGTLLTGMFRRGLTLVATSNVPPQELYKDGLQRQRFLPAIALIESHMDIVHIDSGLDYRLRQLERAPTYLDSGLEATPSALKACYIALAGGAAVAPVTLKIEGRPLRAVAAGPDIAWFEFRELCEGARGQNDYIELARLYGTLLIANIPQFTPQDEDAARRFIVLIDELYDRGVKIVVSAASPPASLYHGERLTFEFQRAASLLVEMQTQQYLAGRHRA